MTILEFSEVFTMLAIQLRQTDADEATIRAYFMSLKNLELEFLAMAAKRLAVSAAWFPKTSEWRDEAVKVEREREEAQRALLRKLPEPLCLACLDTSWERIGEAVRPCACRRIRRLEVLGRQPWPLLPAARDGDPTQEPLVLALVSAAVKGIK